MNRGSCDCKEVQFEIDTLARSNVKNADSETEGKLSIVIPKSQLLFNCAPSSIAILHEANGDSHCLCKICGSILYIQKGNREECTAEVDFEGHDVLSDTCSPTFL